MEKEQKDIKEDVSEIEEKCKDEIVDSKEDCSFVAEGDLVVRDMPELKVLEQLKNETGAIDIGKTIKDLFASMQNMDAQLNAILAINKALEKDLEASKDVVARLKAENNELQEKNKALNDEMPSKRELKYEIERLIEERNEAQAMIRSMKKSVEKQRADTKELNDKISELEGEKADLQRDIHYLEIKLNSAIEKLNSYAKEIATLKGERVSLMEKYERQNQQLKQCLEEKKKLQNYNLNI
ncbi:MAG TPA: hypothetical protein HPP56_01345 [Nitrospirae bacterium]|nr:hypothetical protein [Nitrospirota bacterium]